MIQSLRRFLWTASLAALTAALTACGGHADEQPIKAMVSFGDSLSDVGTYRTPGIAALGGGQYNVNGSTATGSTRLNWTEHLAASLGLPPPCAARVGLAASGPFASLAAPVQDVPGCENHAQGGARVTAPIGPANPALLAAGNPAGYVGQLTEPVSAQIAHHLAHAGGRFAPQALVTLWAGANDLFMQLDAMQAAIAGGAAPQAASQQALQAMATAGSELAALVRTHVVGKGANFVVVLNAPDVGRAPFALAQPQETRSLITSMSEQFNAALAAGLQDLPGVVQVDAFAQSQAHLGQPAAQGITNVTTPACDLSRTAFASSLVCSTPATVMAADISHWYFADTAHPGPYAHTLFASAVRAQLVSRGWVAAP